MQLRLLGVQGTDDGPRLVLQEADGATLRRSVQDVKRLARGGPTSLPKKALSRLAAVTWARDGPGWERFMKKSVTAVEAWLAEALVAAGAGAREAFLDEALYASAAAGRAAQRAAEARPRQLQQYFASATNAEAVVAAAVACAGGAATSFLEPSFGDGRVLARLAASAALPAGSGVYGNEIDPAMHARVVAQGPAAAERLLCGDFLAATARGLGLPPGRRLVVFGGPPYTLGGGTGLVTGDPASRSLPLLFLERAACLGAAAVVFLLPPRCGAAPFVEAAKAALAGSSDGAAWDVVTRPADDRFDFVDRNVSQPAVLQVWERR